MLTQLPNDAGISLFASGTIYRNWRSGQPTDFSYVLDVGVGVEQNGERSARIIMRLEHGGYSTFSDAKIAIENAGIDGIVMSGDPDFDGERVDRNGCEEVAGVQVVYRDQELIRLQRRT